MVNYSDQELVSLYLETGGGHYFAQLYTRHRQRVYQKCLFYTGSSDDSEDFVQDIFVRLIRKLTSYKGDAKFTTWLHTVTVNYCIDQLRKQQQDQHMYQAYQFDPVHTAEWGTTSDESYFATFEQVLKQLSRPQRELLLAKYEGGVQIKDLADQQALTASAVKMRIKRARDRARTLYDRMLSGEEHE
ncbi:RNA polymerase sigma factor [Nostoc sp. CHAB 5834]|nr:RNA polymerase sigma factor [Nostoc sp. CHAB 5834]